MIQCFRYLETDEHRCALSEVHEVKIFPIVLRGVGPISALTTAHIMQLADFSKGERMKVPARSDCLEGHTFSDFRDF